jgi:hypothetical protein
VLRGHEAYGQFELPGLFDRKAAGSAPWRMWS